MRVLIAAALPLLVAAAPLPLAQLPRMGQVSPRFQGYNIEMVEVTGGRFWAPYGGPADEVYRQRPPIDLANPRLRALARQLGPSLVRVSGTWANNTYVAAPGETPAAPPAGFNQVLLPAQWRGVLDFAKAVDARIVTSFAASAGTRGADGVWQPAQAQRLVDATKAAGGSLFAAEFFNEPNIPSATQGMPAGYDAAAYARDFRRFRQWARTAVPSMLIIGPGGVGEGALNGKIPARFAGRFVASADMMRLNPGTLDAVSYHFYGSVSQRCAAMGMGTAVAADALTPGWLDRTLRDQAFYAGLRDQYEPGKPLWNTETAQAACGGSPWAASFADSFRYVNQLGALAQAHVQVVLHNTLAASDYALLDPDTLAPRPNYWAAVLWRRTMGPVVLAPPESPGPQVRLFAQCLAGGRSGVGLAVLNLGGDAVALPLPKGARAWVMQGVPLTARTITVNGVAPGVDGKGRLTGLAGVSVQGDLALPGQSIAFVAVAGAGNRAC